MSTQREEVALEAEVMQTANPASWPCCLGPAQMRPASYFSCSYLLLHLAEASTVDIWSRTEVRPFYAGPPFVSFPASTKDFLGARHHKLDQQGLSVGPQTEVLKLLESSPHPHPTALSLGLNPGEGMKNEQIQPHSFETQAKLIWNSNGKRDLIWEVLFPQSCMRTVKWLL